MFGNDRIGDCTCVAAHQMVQTWSANTDTKDYRPVARDVILTYSRPDRINRRTGEHRRRRQHAGRAEVVAPPRPEHWPRAIDAFAAVDTDDVKESRCHRRSTVFGGVYLGFALPEYVESKPRWHMADSPGGQAARAYGFGGHAVFGCAYDADGITVISWGRRTHVDWAFLHRYLDEAYACLDDFGSTATVAFTGRTGRRRAVPRPAGRSDAETQGARKLIAADKHFVWNTLTRSVRWP